MNNIISIKKRVWWRRIQKYWSFQKKIMQNLTHRLFCVSIEELFSWKLRRDKAIWEGKTGTATNPSFHEWITTRALMEQGCQQLLFINLCLLESKGHGRSCTTAPSGMHRYLTVCICLKPPTSPCAVTIHKTYTDQRWNEYQNSTHFQDQRSMCWQHTKHFDLSQYNRRRIYK